MTIAFEDDRLPSRYWEKVNPEPASGCWLWTAATDRKGYGRTGRGSRRQGTIGAHVWMAWIAIGMKPTPDHMVLHSCDTPACVNPDHLRWGLAEENSRQMVERGRSTRVTHCKNGHPAEGNRYSNGGCKPCARRRAREKRDEKRRSSIGRH